MGFKSGRRARLNTVLTGLAFTCGAWGQEGLTARQMFNKQQPASVVPSTPAAPAKKNVTALPVPSQKTNPAPNGTPGGAVAIAPGPARITAPVTESRWALAMRYSILKLSGRGESEVDAQSVFHSGDRIRLTVEANDAGFLYVVSRGSSGVWKPLFPSEGWDNQRTQVQANKRYDIPPGQVFSFDEQTGSERMMVVLTRTPARSFEDLVESLQRQTRRDGDPEMVALARPLDDAMVERLEKLYSRDLVVEKSDSPASAPQEHAVYVANASSAQDARVIADVVLVHR